MRLPLRRLVAAAAALAVGVLGVHAWISLASGFDVNHVSGVWLALARDLNDGLFYRDLIGPAGYGGTRYFPLFFALITVFLRAGLDIVVAGYAASIVGAIVMLAGAYAFAVRIGIPRTTAIPLTVLATVAPYFVQQSVFAIRAEPLAAGLALWGLSRVASSSASWPQAAVAALLFMLAVAAKPTTAWAPVAALLALALGRRRADAARLMLLTGSGVLAFFAGIHWLSQGRFVRSLQTVALAGEAAGSLLSPGVVLRFAGLAAGSRLLAVILLLTAVAFVVCLPRWRQLPALTVVTAAGVTAVVLGTPGTILANHVIELWVTAVLFLGWCASSWPQAARIGPLLLAVLLLWTSGQNAVRATRLRGDSAATAFTRLRPAIVTAVHDCNGPIFAESPMIPLAAGVSPIVLDPFALRVVTHRAPAVLDDLTARLSERRFTCIVLDQDPAVPRGGAWYERVHFGRPVIDAVLDNYEHRASVGPHRFYRPRP